MSKRHAGDALGSAPGGCKQKARWAAALADAAAPVRPPSKLARYLIEKWGWGLLSAPALQETAAAAIADGADHPDVMWLAKLGCSGKYPGKCHSELLSKLDKQSFSTILTTFRVHYKVGNVLSSAQHCALLPHEIFATLYNEHQAVFVESMLGGSRSNLTKFWNCMSHHPALDNHPIAKVDGYKGKYVPLAIHGDGVAISGCGRSWSRSIDVFSMSSVIGKGPTLLTNFLMYLYSAKFICKGLGINSLSLFIKRLIWSLFWLAVGKWPKKDWNDVESKDPRAGTDLAGGLCGVLWTIRADLDFLAKGLGLEYYGSNDPCVCCKANRSDVPWTDAKPTADWIGKMWSKTDWKLAHPSAHALLTKVVGVSILNVIPDIMHVFHLGVYMYFFGSLLKYLAYHWMRGDPEDNVKSLFAEIKEQYEAYGITCRFSDLRTSMFWSGKDTDFPLMKGKAAEIKGLVKPLLVVVLRHLPDSVAEHVIMKQQLEHAVRIEELLEVHKDEYVLPPAARDAFTDSCFKFAQLNTALGQKFHGRGICLFNHTIKMHYACHIGLAAQYINPRLCWCYSGEDLMHKVKLLVQGSYKGTRPILVPPKVLNKYCVALSLWLEGIL